MLDLAFGISDVALQVLCELSLLALRMPVHLYSLGLSQRLVFSVRVLQEPLAEIFGYSVS